MADAWRSMYTYKIICQREKLPPDGAIINEVKVKYQNLFARKLEDVKLAALNLAAGETARDLETQRIVSSATPAHWAQ